MLAVDEPSTRIFVLSFISIFDFISYSALSAASKRVSTSSPSVGQMATPALTDSGGILPSSASLSHRRWAADLADSIPVSGNTTANSSPPKRAAVSIFRQPPLKTSASRHSASLPVKCPYRSLISFNLSKSKNNSAKPRPVRLNRLISLSKTF